MSEPLRRVATTDNYVNPQANIKAWRIAFKVTDATYNFSSYDQLDLGGADYDFLEDEVLTGNTFYDLCRIKGNYKPYHKDYRPISARFLRTPHSHATSSSLSKRSS